MDALLDKYLCNKYPKIFAERDLPMDKSCMYWGLAVGNGWFSLIKELCHKIQYDIDYRTNCINSGYEWAIQKGAIPQVVAKQVKEKFGGLCFYYDGGDDKIQGMVDLAEDLSYSICEDCGYMNETVGKSRVGWIKTTCPKHATSPENFVQAGDAELINIWKEIQKNDKRQEKIDKEAKAKI